MKIKYSALVSDASGKLNGSVATKNRYGSYIRNKVTPINRKSTAQVTVRQNFTAVSQTWRGLTAAQRSQWNESTSNFTRTNIFGDIRNLSGFNLFAKLNNNLLVTGQSQITVCPLPPAVQSVTLTSATMANGTPSASLVFSGVISTGTLVIVEATTGLSAGKSFVKSELRKIAVLTNSDTTPKNILSAYTAKFGSVPPAGSKVIFQFKVIDKLTGVPGSTSKVECIVAA